MIISEELVSALNLQIAHEKFNANLYMYIAGFLRNKGLGNLANHFMHQHDEETDHSKMVFDLLTDLNQEIIPFEVDAPMVDFSSIKTIAKAYVDREIETTESLNEIKVSAIDSSCPIVEEFMRKMIVNQQKEMEEALDFQDKAELLSEWWQVALWDLEAK